MKPGDLVELASGGPPMVILEWNTGIGFEGWLCAWQVQGSAKRDTYPPHVLRPYDPETPLEAPPGRPEA